MSDLLGLLTEDEAELVTKARNSLKSHDRWGKWVVVGCSLLSAAVCLGLSYLILALVVRMNLALPQQGVLWGLGIGMTIGAVAGCFLMQGMQHLLRAMSYSQEMRVIRLLVKLHDALSAFTQQLSPNQETQNP